MSNPTVGAGVNPSELLDRQYRDSKKLEARANLHRRYGRSDGPDWFVWTAQQANLSAGAKVLDIGCGPGWLWEAGKAGFPADLDLTLADFSPGMVEAAVKQATTADYYAHVEGVVADVSHLPFADASFDAVLACHMLYHVPDATVALKELRRVLRPGGIIAVTTNAEGNMEPLYALGAAAFDGAASDPAADIFGLHRAKALMEGLFDDVVMTSVSGDLNVTSAEDLVLALTSFPPGQDADDAAVAKLYELTKAAIAAGGGAIHIPKTQGMVRGLAPL
jgi:SAM-dependent methyltransferase